MPQDLRDQDLLDYESRHQPLASMQRYALRLVVSFLIACLLIGGSLGAGMWGYAHFEGMSWLDAFLNAAMILSGMGPADQLKTDAGKVFAGCYALYSGLVIVLASGIILAPIVHRILHRFHVDEAD
ncbi:MAG TPA: hypothetical protein VFA64_03115 [Hyphomicrobiaceae bacterium]|nr:hypothetical protein [Hyphomicrobiaceae bacterium]